MAQYNPTGKHHPWKLSLRSILSTILILALAQAACGLPAGLVAPGGGQPTALSGEALGTAISGTLTASVPTATPVTPSPTPTLTPVASDTPPPSPTPTNTPPPTATFTPVPSDTPPPPPTATPPFYFIQGGVVDSAGMPIDGINLAIIHTTSGTRFDAYSGPDGRFTQQIPSYLGNGPYQVEVVGYMCTSRIMDANCKLTAFAPPKNIEQVSLPQSSDLRYVFQIIAAPVSQCPPLEPGTRLFEDPHVCFLYPDSPMYRLTFPGATTLRVEGPAGGGSTEPVAPFYTFEIYDAFAGPANPKHVAEKWASDNGLASFPLQYGSLNVGGEQGITVNGEPGIAAGLRVFVVHGGVAYMLYVWPTDVPAVSVPMAYMWNLLIDSLRFK
jgi:hypothetical protein